MNILNFILLQCGVPPKVDPKNPPTFFEQYGFLIMMVLIVVVFWLFFIRPQSKKNKELQKFREALKRGDKVITAGGIQGKILEVQDTTVVIETEGLGKLKIEKSSIASSVAGNGE